MAAVNYIQTYTRCSLGSGDTIGCRLIKNQSIVDTTDTGLTNSFFIVQFKWYLLGFFSYEFYFKNLIELVKFIFQSFFLYSTKKASNRHLLKLNVDINRVKLMDLFDAIVFLIILLYLIFLTNHVIM